MECVGGYTFLDMTSIILSGGLKMRDEHGMLRGVYISRHDFCPTFRWYETPAGFPGKRGSQPELKMLGFFFKKS